MASCMCNSAFSGDFSLNVPQEETIKIMNGKIIYSKDKAILVY